MRDKRFAFFAVSLAFVLTATMAGAAGPGGVGGIGGLGSMRPVGPVNRVSSLPRRSGVSMGGTMSGSMPSFPFPTNDPNRYHEIKLIGRLGKDESGLTIDQQIVRMRVDGRSIPMSVNGDAISNSLQFDQGDELGQTLYRLILSKQLEVVGDPKLRNQIADDAAVTPPKKVLVDGFVYDRTKPYLVLVSVHDAP
jgi:hypothetical protein